MPTNTHTYFRPQAKHTRQPGTVCPQVHSKSCCPLKPSHAHDSAHTPLHSTLHMGYRRATPHHSDCVCQRNVGQHHAARTQHNSPPSPALSTPPARQFREDTWMLVQAARPKDAHPVESSSCIQPTACATHHALHVQPTTALHAQATNALHAQQRHSLHLPTHPATQQPAASHI